MNLTHCGARSARVWPGRLQKDFLPVTNPTTKALLPLLPGPFASATAALWGLFIEKSALVSAAASLVPPRTARLLPTAD